MIISIRDTCSWCILYDYNSAWMYNVLTVRLYDYRQEVVYLEYDFKTVIKSFCYLIINRMFWSGFESYWGGGGEMIRCQYMCTIYLYIYENMFKNIVIKSHYLCRYYFYQYNNYIRLLELCDQVNRRKLGNVWKITGRYKLNFRYGYLKIPTARTVIIVSAYQLLF